MCEAGSDVGSGAVSLNEEQNSQPADDAWTDVNLNDGTPDEIDGKSQKSGKYTSRHEGKDRCQWSDWK